MEETNNERHRNRNIEVIVLEDDGIEAETEEDGRCGSNDDRHKEFLESLFGSDEESMADRNIDVIDLEEDDTQAQMEEDVNTGSNNEENVVRVPAKGMVFPNVVSLFNFYQDYARSKGFVVLKTSAYKGHGNTGEVFRYITISCDRGRNAKDEKKSKKIECKARLNTGLNSEGLWLVNRIKDVHNHTLDPKMSRMMPSHKNLKPEMKRQLKANDISRIKPSLNFRSIQTMFIKMQNLNGNFLSFSMSIQNQD